MKKSNNPKKNAIVQFVDHGQFETGDIGCLRQLLNDAGGMLDSAESHEICGTPIFKCADGRWYVGSVEFVVNPVNPDYLLESLVDEKAECDNCGHIEPIDDLNCASDLNERVDDDGEEPDGECTKCGALSYRITPKRAKEIAGIAVPKQKPKRQRRRGGLK